MQIEKTTPMGGGMGGGSSNGAVMLKALNELWNLGLSDSRLEQFAATFGSDCSFFIKSHPAICTGRGEIIEPKPLAHPLHLVMVNPGFGVSTKWAYDAYANCPAQIAPPIQGLIDCINAADWPRLQNAMFNSLELPVLEKHLFLKILKQDLIDAGAMASMMSGSGATVFGVAPSQEEAEQIARKMRDSYGEKLFIAVCRTLPESGS
ncbi:4-(cytidine 5'-diphospho)-2-C-methyl-D-erythritol kinase [Kamptonema cortianum]|nr:4-(cytidine 5'-diphospho)-2-C-methyl-D-erythritol kinase [Kamptonema cortianum]